jgi:hypothetical protein
VLPSRVLGSPCHQSWFPAHRRGFRSKLPAGLPVAWRPHASAATWSNLLARIFRLLARAYLPSSRHLRLSSNNEAAPRSTQSSASLTGSWIPGLGARAGSAGPVAVVISPRLHGTGMVTTGRSQIGGRASGHTIIAMAVPGTSEQLKRQVSPVPSSINRGQSMRME